MRTATEITDSVGIPPTFQSIRGGMPIASRTDALLAACLEVLLDIRDQRADEHPQPYLVPDYDRVGDQ